MVARRTWCWQSESLGRELRMAGWGHFGKPVLWLPTAVDDHLEPARLGLIEALAPLLGAGRLKLYAISARPSELQSPGLLEGEWVPRVLADCAQTRQPLGLVGAARGAEGILGVILALTGRVDRALALSGAPILGPAPQGLELVVLAWGSDPREPGTKCAAAVHRLKAAGLPIQASPWGPGTGAGFDAWRQVLPILLLRHLIEDE